MVKIIEDRDNLILNAAIELAQEDSFQWITRDAVAERAGVSPGTVNNAYGTIADLKRAVLRAAVERRILSIIAEALGVKHPIAMEAPEDLRKEALATLVA